jgi:xanthine/CO dehydrogenase XdhC/CoxF family maturation factor
VTARALSKKQFPSIDVIGSNDPHEIALSIAA